MYKMVKMRYTSALNDSVQDFVVSETTANKFELTQTDSPDKPSDIFSFNGLVEVIDDNEHIYHRMAAFAGRKEYERI